MSSWSQRVLLYRSVKVNSFQCDCSKIKHLFIFHTEASLYLQYSHARSSTPSVTHSAHPPTHMQRHTHTNTERHPQYSSTHTQRRPQYSSTHTQRRPPFSLTHNQRHPQNSSIHTQRHPQYSLTYINHPSPYSRHSSSTHSYTH